MFRFGAKEAFATYLWIVPIVVMMGIFFARRAQKRIELKLGARLSPFLMSSISTAKRRWKLALEILSIVTFVVAMARPQMGASLQEVKSEGVEIMLLIDVSKSMMAEDNRPNRLEVVKIELKKLLDRLTGDKVGIVVFAGNAFLVSPLTTDYSAVKLFIDSLSTESVSTQGTEFRPALDVAVEAFKRGGVSDEEGAAVTKVIVIASDGEDHEEGALAAASKYANQGVKIFGLGVGTEQGAPVPVRDEFGYLKGYLKDSSGQIVNSRHKGEFLTKLAVTGGGGYYHLSNSNAIDQLKTQLDTLQKAQFESSLATEYDEKFQAFLLFGIIFGLIELLLGERKVSNVIWRGRVGALSVLVFLMSPGAMALATPNEIHKNNSAVDSLKEKQVYQSYKSLMDLLAENPFQPEIRLNLAYAYELNEEFEKAIKEYLFTATHTDNEKLKFEAYFNAARLLGEQKKIPEALSSYQRALEIEPSSMEVKTNIELLLSQNKGGGEGDKDEDKNKDQKDKEDQKKEEKDKKDGKGDPKDSDKKDDKGEQKGPGQYGKNQKRAPQPFKSEELSERDVKNILEELKRQEEKNRAKVMEQPQKENTSGPDW